MWWLLSILFFCFFSVTHADQNLSSEIIYGPDSKEVEVTILIDEISDISISEGNYKLNSEILFSWNDPKVSEKKIKIIDLTDNEEKKVDDVWYPKFTIVNEESPREISIKIITTYPDGRIELYERFNTILAMDTDIKQYPFGSLNLMLEISAYSQTINELNFKPINFFLGHDEIHRKSLVKGNWTIDKYYFKEKIKKSINLRQGQFSHNEFHLKVHHDYTDSIQKILAPIFIVIIISLFINYFCRMKFSENADFNINGQLVLLLTLVALRFSLGEELPKTHYLNLTDLLFLSSYIICAFNLLGSIVLQSFYQNQNKKNSELTEKKFVSISIFVALFLIIGSILFTL